jgi:GxxExxY protein
MLFSYSTGIGGKQRVSFGAKFAKDENELGKIILDAAFRVHTAIGPGLLESAYEACLAFELRNEGLNVLTQVPLPLVYRNVKLDVGYRLDLLVEDLVVVEIKSVDSLIAIHQAQVISYLKLSGKKLGILINFNTLHLRDGIKRVVHGL